jgi:hypothetical protein
MKKKLLLASVFTLGSLLLFTPYVYTNSDGTPGGGYAGPAVNEYTCTNCHTGNPLNAAGGTFSLQLLDGSTNITSYEPGKKYTVKVSLTYQGAKRLGFEATVKNFAKTKPAGVLSPGGNNLVRFAPFTMNYITHTTQGSSVQNSTSWTFDWTAPVKGTGQVIISACGNAGNGSGNEFGDHIYTNSINIGENGVASIEKKELFSENLSLYPNPVQNFMAMDFVLPVASKVTASVYSLDGKLVLQNEKGLTEAGNQLMYIDMSSLEKGIYFVRLSAGEELATKKVVKL